MHKLVDQIKKRIASKNTEEQKEEEHHNNGKGHEQDPEIVIKELRKNVEAKNKAIKMLHQ
jgi:hypothetical protein